MANNSEYKMLLKLSAQLGSEFNGTFSAAQKTLNSTQKEIAELNKAQSEISAYEKQQAAISATSRKLEDLKKEYDNIQREIEETEGFSSSLENKLIEKQRAIDRTSASLENQKSKLDETGAAMRSAGVDTDNLSGESERLKKQIDDLADQEARLAREAKNYGVEGASAFELVGTVASAVGITKIVSELASFYGEAFTGAHQNADALLTMSTQYGISAEKLQIFQYAAELADVSVDTFTSTLTRNTRSMYSALEGSSAYVEAYEKLDVKVKDSEGNLRDSETVYWEVIDALGQMTNESERDGIAMTLLGRNAQQLNPLIKAGSQTIKEYQQEAQKAGYILSDDVLVTLGKLNDEEHRQQNNMTALKNTIGSAFAPELLALKQINNELLADVSKFAQDHPVVVKSIVAITAEVGLLLVAYKGFQVAKTAMNTLKAASRLLNEQEASSAVKAAAATQADAAASGADAAAKTTQKVATEGAAAAQGALNATMSVNPVFLLITGAAALTVGLISLTQATKTEVEEQDALTASSKAQYDQLQELNAEYERARQLYGESSDEARRLHGEYLLRAQEFEASKQTVAEYNAEVQRMIEEYDSFVSGHRENIRAIDTELDVNLALISQLSALEKQTNKTVGETARMAELVDLLNDRVPQLAISYDKVSDSMSGMTISQIREAALSDAETQKRDENIESWKKAVVAVEEFSQKYESANKELKNAQKNYDKIANTELGKKYLLYSNTDGPESILTWTLPSYRKIGTQLSEAGTVLYQAKQNANDLLSSYNKSVQTRDELEKQLFSNSSAFSPERYIEKQREFKQALQAVRRGYLDVDAAAKLYGTDASVLQSKIEETTKYENMLNEALGAVKNGYYTASEAANAYGMKTSDIETMSRIDSLVEEGNALCKTYNDLKTSAEQSMSTQFELWEQAATVTVTDVKTMNTALETQRAYWANYRTDLNNLISRSGNIEGLSEFVRSFADGSEKSVNTVAGLAKASDKELQALITEWKEAQSEIKLASGALAELGSDFDDRSAEIAEELQSVFDELDMYDQAEEAGRAMIDGYIAGMKDGKTAAASEASKVRQMIVEALFGTYSVSQYSETPGSRADKRALQRYAEGTGSAIPGLAIVGEYGPELVSFSGGEKVYTASETRNIVRDVKGRDLEISPLYPAGSGAVITVSPVFNVENGSDDDIERRLRIFTEEIVDEVKEALAEAGIDAKRGVYA